MFTIKTKTDYGLIIMIELAKNYKKGFLPLSSIFKQKNISANYLTQIAQYFIKSGLILSKEGSGGGYKLSKPPAQISVLEVIESIEGDNINIKCLSGKNKKCACVDPCETRRMWASIATDIKKSLAKKTLANLIKS